MLWRLGSVAPGRSSSCLDLGGSDAGGGASWLRVCALLLRLCILLQGCFTGRTLGRSNRGRGLRFGDGGGVWEGRFGC